MERMEEGQLGKKKICKNINVDSTKNYVREILMQEFMQPTELASSNNCNPHKRENWPYDENKNEDNDAEYFYFIS